jgi:hypothetical protein
MAVRRCGVITSEPGNRASGGGLSDRIWSGGSDLREPDREAAFRFIRLIDAERWRELPKKKRLVRFQESRVG